MCVNIFSQLSTQNLCSWEKAKKVTLKCLGWLPNVSLLSNSQEELGLVCTQNNMISMNSKSLLKLLQEYMWIPKAKALTIVRILVFCLQTSKNLSRVIIWWTRSYKFLKHCKKKVTIITIMTKNTVKQQL